MKELVSMGSGMFLQLLFSYIFISVVLLELNPWYAVVVYVAIVIISLLLGIYSIAFPMKSSLNTIFLILPGGIIITLFSILIIGFTVFAYFLREGDIPAVIRL
ncbi:alpha/beta hydrolase [Bacillus mycoides]|uniref:alpha/beta hydrolase n=1 Tax=Bacillus mycoides TaxID=1405 RepID=UPI001C017EB3|nr:alpha/beta hydrolase [Bacillus mycoides]QWG63149.1 alpha/beta hydrolase [Bacillus mycoides]QWG89322.1 alpha/beta hydrolase [Bacillus mycoides]QWJ08083.1 alpha/beta hydrolase [Bacillus mycoides]